MAIFEDIRRRSGLVIVLIGLSLLAFVLTDLLSSGGVLFVDDSVGTINGKEVKIQEFNAEMEELRQGNPQYAQMSALQLSEMLWNKHLNEALMTPVYDELGIQVSQTELMEAITTNPNITGMAGFVDPNTGQFNKSLFLSAISNLRDNRGASEEAKSQWLNWIQFENDIREQTLQQKFNVAFSKGMRMPEGLVRHEYLRNAATAQAELAYIPYSSIPDSEVTPTDDDFEEYYEETKEMYRTDKDLRNVLFANFELVPSESDAAKVKDAMTALAVEYRASTNDSDFIARNSEVPFQDQYIKEADLSNGLDTLVKGRPVGYLAGPVYQQSAAQLMKVLDRRIIPDSARARHILIGFAGAQRSEATRTYQQAQKLADSLLAVIKSNPGSFDALNAQFSGDAVAKAKGGDLDWFGANNMTKAFEDFCFRKSTGTLGVVATEFGFHVVQVTGQKGGSPAIQLGLVVRSILPSAETEAAVYAAATKFSNKARELKEGWQAMAEQEKVALRPAEELGATDENVPGLGQAREVVRWAFNEERELGDVQVINNESRGYVVAILTQVAPKGYRSLEVVKERIRPMVVQRAKARLLMERLEKEMPKGMANAATALKGTYSPATVSMASPFLMVSGQEPELVGRLVGSKKGDKSNAFRGYNGVYAYVVQSVQPAADKGVYTVDVANATMNVRSRAAGGLFQALIKKADVNDRRGQVF
jgi:peptidyl-prolyl cis-trans isomerase D